MRAEILTVGTELLLGDILNSNSQFLSRELAAYGIDILFQSTVGDNAERLNSALSLALGRCDLVIVTGGLGPTEDDITRETVAAYFNLPLVLHEETDRRIRDYFQRTGREYSQNNQKQAMLPEGCTVFPNDHGTAPGCAVERYGQTVILLPGPPKELIPMFTEYVTPYLSKRSGGTIHSHTVGVFGIPESVVDERLQDLMQGENPTVAPYAKEGEVVLRVTAKAESAEEADRLCLPVIEEIRERLGTAVYGVDASSLQKTVVSMLKEKDLTIATAESCTAGLLSGRLTEVPGVSEVFECGIAAYSKEIKHQVLGVSETVLREKGAVSPETAAAMAMGARRVGEADIGIGITGVAGPEPSEEKAVGTVYVALADDRRVWVKKIFAGHGSDDREQIRYAATSHALDMTRRYLEAFPGVMAGGQTLDKLSSGEDTMGARLSPRTKKMLWFTALITVLVAALILTYVYLLTPYINRKKFEELWDAYSQGVVQPDPDGEIFYPDGILTRFLSLYRTNSDIRGWVTIENSNINYPVVQEPSDGYYADRDFYQVSSPFGVPYVDENVTISSAEENRSLVIYGNNSGNGQMFSDLTAYTDLDFLRDHGVIEFNTLFREDKYKIFAVMIVGDAQRYSDNFDYTVDEFEDEEEFIYYVSQIRQRSLFDTTVGVGEGDDLLMLTTPIDYGFDGARIVVAARRVRADEDSENDLSRARVNTNVLMPLAWQIQQGDITAATVTTTTAVSTTDTTAGDSTSEQTTVTHTTDGSAADTTGGKETTVTTTVTAGGTTTTTATTVSTTVTTTTVTAATTASTTAPSGGNTVTPPSGTLATGTIAESEFMKLFAVRNTNSSVTLPGQDAGGVIRPTTKEQLQYVLASVVKVELGSSSTMVNSVEAQKAQAVASYSFILYQSAGGTPYAFACQAINLNNTRDKKIFDAVGEVLGVKLVDTNGKTAKNMLCSAFYSASTGGNTSSSNKVWTGILPYAVSVPSPYDNELIYYKYGLDYGGKKFVNTTTITRDELYTKVKNWVAKNYSGCTMPEEQFTTDDSKLPLYATAYDGDGTAGQGDAWNYVYNTNFYYVKNGAKVYLKGHQMRTILDLKSHAFRTTYDAATKTVKITTQGHGHGVGLSQMGAVGYANEAGWDYVQILKHYYSVTDKSRYQIVAPVW